MFEQERKKFRDLFAQYIQETGPELSLGQLALCLAGEEYPFLDSECYVNQLTELASNVQETVDGSTDQCTLIEGLNHVLFEKQGFTGDTVDCPDPERYFINRVLDTRLGIPLTLSLIYLELARRIGIKCCGIGLPGNFVVRLDALDLFLDPFHSGQLLSTVDCRYLVRETVGSHLPWREEFITPYSDQDILFRLLNNLKTVYMQNEDYARAVDALKKMILINPSAHYLNRDLTWCYYNIHDHPTALQHLELYLQECWPCSDPSEMQYQAESIWSTISRLE